jgi:SAM-dependent methyltransferase
MPDFARIYAHSDYLTPGAADTVELIAETVQPDERTFLLDVACGKGEAAASLAGRFTCKVLAVDLYDPFIHVAAAKGWFFNLRDLVSIVRADGKRLPVRDATFDAAYCIGAPSIVGLDSCLSEMARTVKPRGCVIVSDIVWRTKPEARLGAEWRWVAQMQQLSLDDYTSTIESAGLRVEQTVVFPRSVWEDYWRPMLQVAQEAKTAQPADIFFADDVEFGIDLERRALDLYLDYAAFIARKP